MISIQGSDEDFSSKAGIKNLKEFGRDLHTSPIIDFHVITASKSLHYPIFSHLFPHIL